MCSICVRISRFLCPCNSFFVLEIVLNSLFVLAVGEQIIVKHIDANKHEQHFYNDSGGSDSFTFPFLIKEKLFKKNLTRLLLLRWRLK
jgi:hypothetical protein